MNSIKFANGTLLPLIMCFDNGKRFIYEALRNTREFQIPNDAIELNVLKELVSNPSNLERIEVVGDDNETEILENFVFPEEIKYSFDNGIWITLGQKTDIEIEHEEALASIDELLIAMEV